MESKTPTQDNTMNTETTTTGQALHTKQIAAIKVAVTRNPSANKQEARDEQDRQANRAAFFAAQGLTQVWFR